MLRPLPFTDSDWILHNKFESVCRQWSNCQKVWRQCYWGKVCTCVGRFTLTTKVCPLRRLGLYSRKPWSLPINTLVLALERDPGVRFVLLAHNYVKWECPIVSSGWLTRSRRALSTRFCEHLKDVACASTFCSLGRQGSSDMEVFGLSVRREDADLVLTLNRGPLSKWVLCPQRANMSSLHFPKITWFEDK